MNTYNSAKNILDFYIDKLSSDIDNPEAQFAMQYADLHLLKMRTNAVLDALESYDIEYEQI